jgi:sulfonate transport system permease protein
MTQQIAERVAAAPVSKAVPRRKTRLGRFKWPLGLLLPAVIVVFWGVAYQAHWINPVLFSSPIQVAATLWSAILDGSLLANVGASVERWIIGFLIGAVVGVFFGAITGFSRIGERLLDTTFQMFRTVPIMGLVPLFVIWFGLGELPKVILIAFASMFQIYLATYAGIRGVDRKLIEVGRVYQLSTLQMFRRVIFPAAMPTILQGIRIGLGVAWLALVIAELNGATNGIGYWMQMGRQNVRVDIVLAALIVFAVVGKVVDVLVRALEKRLLRWRDTFESEM